MAFVLEISTRVISQNAEECFYKNDDGHNADGTGPECDPHCKHLDGDVREIRDDGTHSVEMDADDLEEYGSPVSWAAYYLAKHHPDASHGTMGTPGPNGDTVNANGWLSGSTADPYRDEQTETTVYVKGQFTDAQRGQVFKLAAMDYGRMVDTLAGWGL